jgi:hypothetical protein
MNAQQTLKAVYEFTAQNYESLKHDWNKLSKKEKQRIPFALFVIGVFSATLEDYNEQTTRVETKEPTQS